MPKASGNEVLSAGSDSGGGGGGGSYPTAVAAASAAAAAATVAAAAAAGGEPVKRQKGRFKLREIGEVTFSQSPAPGGVGAGAGTGHGQQSPSVLPSVQPVTTSVQPVTTQGMTTVTAAGLVPGTLEHSAPTGTAPAPPANRAPAPPGGTAPGGAPAGPPLGTSAGTMAASPDVQATILLLVEQNRQLLEKWTAMNPATAGATADSVPPLSNNITNIVPHTDRGRTASMSALTLQTPLPPKPPSSGSAVDRNQSPLMRETPAGWWGAQQAGQAQTGQLTQPGQGGQPPRRPASAGVARSGGESGIAGGAVGGGGLQGGGAGGVGGGVTAAGSGGGAGGSMSGVVKVRDDGTGRRAERGRLSTLLDQLKDEIEFHAAAKRDMDLELKRVSVSWCFRL